MSDAQKVASTLLEDLFEMGRTNPGTLILEGAPQKSSYQVVFIRSLVS